MKIDAHVHMKGKEKNAGEFVRRLQLAGFDASVVFSPAPDGMLGKTGNNDQRLEQVIEYTKGYDMLFPFYFIDPTEEDAIEQLIKAKDAGAVGFKIICNHFYPWDDRAMGVYHWIAEHDMPLMFHSGILYDGINVSGKYNRPCEFEPLLSVNGLRFSLAHISWPWTAECIAVLGKFDFNLECNPNRLSAKMHIDLTPGTPPTFRNEALKHLFGNGFNVSECVFWGSDNSVGDYNWEYAKSIRERDEIIFTELGLSEKMQQNIFGDNFIKFLKNV